MSAEHSLRIFVANATGWTETTSAVDSKVDSKVDSTAIRITAPDLQRAQRARTRIRAAADVSVILDLTVLVGGDFRSARTCLAALDADTDSTVHYAGTIDGLTGLVADIFVAGVADGVTLIAASPQQDPRVLGEAVLARLRDRLPVTRAA